MANYEKGIGSVLVNMSLKNVAPLKTFKYLLATGLTIRRCSPDGFPESTEFNNLYKISDEIKASLISPIEVKLSGTFTYQCRRIDYYYLSDTIDVRRRIEEVYKKQFPDYSYSIKISEDQNWRIYLDFLYPNADIQEFMSNQKVIDNLVKEGDDLGKPRVVDHWLYFGSEKDREKFIVYAREQKFSIQSVAKVKSVELPFQLQISREDKVDIQSITKITIALKIKVKELNGVYDGWETVVVKTNK